MNAKNDKQYDVVVIGGGPGGYVAAIRAAQLGLAAAVVEVEHLGGICLNWGCIPTKALLRSAEVYHLARNAEQYGVSVDNVRFDLDAIVKRSRDVSARLTAGIGYLLKKNKVDVYEGRGRLADEGRVGIVSEEGRETFLHAGNIILATGARARTLPGLEPDGDRIWTYREALLPTEVPKSLLVVGSGAIGIEFASFFRTLGAEVTVVEIVDRILPAEDEEISALARKAFEQQGIRVLTGAQVESLERNGEALTAAIRTAAGGDESLESDRAILALGIVGNTENLGLEAAGIRVKGGHIIVNEWCETGAPNVYAIGDLVGPPWLAHKASHEGVVVAERIAGSSTTHPLDTQNVPGCTYSSPQVASVGLTEAQAKDQGHEISVGRFPFSANGKALALGDSEGLIKTVIDASTGELLGAHMIGAEVTELIQGYVVARTLEATNEELKETVFPHPTLSEMMHEAILDAEGQALHI
ncbi:MAG: dihydrolipoyl dehydrogenase [Gammaproteobacteria bacterium]